MYRKISRKKNDYEHCLEQGSVSNCTVEDCCTSLIATRPVRIATGLACGMFLGLTICSPVAFAQSTNEKISNEAAPNQPEKTTPAHLAMTSCASCHGSHSFLDPDDPTDQWKSAYQIWASRDPHSRAYNKLWNKQSQQIVTALVTGEMGTTTASRVIIKDTLRYQAAINQYCVACHSSIPASVSAEMLSQPGQRHEDANLVMAEGVNCHSCHSLAPVDDPVGNTWVVAHTKEIWNDPSINKVAMGLRDLSTPTGRAEACVRCHVGSSGRDVNHDLIAAGHPRMVFEYASHLDRLPKHWHEVPSQNYHLTGWSAGQQTTLQATIDLLEHRATMAHNRQGPWPEFAEYHCHNCHHGLGTHWYLPNSALLSGRLGWGTWSLPTGSFPDTAAESAIQIRKEMETLYPDTAKIKQLAENFPDLLTDRSPIEHVQLYLQQSPQLNSDEVFAWYLAVHHAAEDLFPADNETTSTQRTRVEMLLKELKAILDEPFVEISAANQPLQTRVNVDNLHQKILELQQIILPALKRLQNPADP